MKYWESLVGRKIREAMEHGEFADLSGQGQPIDLTENPYEDSDWRTAHRMLRNTGFAPAWIEDRKDLEAEIESVRRTLARVWVVRQNARDTEHAAAAEARWLRALSDFREKTQELNRRIHLWNLKAPAVGFHRPVIDCDREVERITS